jgi:chromate reductase
MNVLAICGSLRARSLNAAMLRAATRLAPDGMQVTLFPTLAGLPLFNPDDEPALPPAVAELHYAVATADALLIASPEYAHGITGSMKNALDWLVSFEPFYGKLVAVLNASSRASHADAALREILLTMSASVVDEASVVIPGITSHMDEEAIVRSPDASAALRAALGALQAATRRGDGHGASFRLS